MQLGAAPRPTFFQRVVPFFRSLFGLDKPAVAAVQPPKAPASGREVLAAPLPVPLGSGSNAGVFQLEAGQPITIIYTYDPLDRLTAADYSNGAYFHYTYDSVGNRQTQAITGGATTTYTYDAANRLTGVDSLTYIWDANGNLLNDGASTYAYDQANRLISVTNQQASTNYSYNGLGDRTQLTTGGVTTDYSLDMGSRLTQVLADGTNTYLYGLGRIAEEDASGAEYFQGDALGSVRQLTDGSGTIILAKGYAPYGKTSSSSGTGVSSYGYTGEQSDQTGLVYLHARYYMLDAGRFMSKDLWDGNYQVPMIYNAWLYVLASPVMYTDASGLCIDEDGDGRCDPCDSQKPNPCSSGVVKSSRTHFIPREPIPENILDRIKLITWGESSEGTHPTWAWDWFTWTMMNRHAVNMTFHRNYARVHTGATVAALKAWGGFGGHKDEPLEPAYVKTVAVLRDPTNIIQDDGICYADESCIKQGDYDSFLQVSKRVDDAYRKWQTGWVDPTNGATFFIQGKRDNIKNGYTFSTIEEARCYVIKYALQMVEDYSSDMAMAQTQLYPFSFAVSYIYNDPTHSGEKIFIYAGNHSYVAKVRLTWK